MPCFGNGKPVNGGGGGSTSGTFYVLTDFTQFGIPKTISIDWTATAEVQLDQLTMHWSGPPATSENIELKKWRAAPSPYDTILRSIDPSAESLEDWTLLAPFRWRVGDRVILTYANSDNLGIGAEIILREV